MSGHPSGVGLWEMWPRGRKRPAHPVTAKGHTAREAWVEAWPRLNGLGFCELQFRLVADVAPEPPTTRDPSPEVVRSVRRRLRAQGVIL